MIIWDRSVRRVVVMIHSTFSARCNDQKFTPHQFAYLAYIVAGFVFGISVILVSSSAAKAEFKEGFASPSDCYTICRNYQNKGYNCNVIVADRQTNFCRINVVRRRPRPRSNSEFIMEPPSTRSTGRTSRSTGSTGNIGVPNSPPCNMILGMCQ